MGYRPSRILPAVRSRPTYVPPQRRCSPSLASPLALAGTVLVPMMLISVCVWGSRIPYDDHRRLPAIPVVTEGAEFQAMADRIQGKTCTEASPASGVLSSDAVAISRFYLYAISVAAALCSLLLIATVCLRNRESDEMTSE